MQAPADPAVAPPIAIVLAGGAARRLGPELVGPAGKAGVAVAGRTFLEAITATLEPLVARIIVVAAAGQPLPEVGAAIEIVRDSSAGAGPLAAIRDGLVYAAAAVGPPPAGVVLLSCDVPLVRRGVVHHLLRRLGESGAEWVVPVVHGHPQVLVSAASPGLRPRIEAHLAAGRRDLRGLLEALRAEDPSAVCLLDEADLAAVDPEGVSFFDVDTPADLAAVRRRIPPSPE